jgi:hypothetical protein
MSTAIHHDRPVTPTLDERIRNNNARPISPAASRKTDPTLKGATSGFMAQFQETANAAMSFLSQQMERFGAPVDMMRNNLYTAVGAAIVAVLIGTIILAYSLFGARTAMPLAPSLQTKTVAMPAAAKGQTKLQGFSMMKDKPKSEDVDMGFSTWADAPDMGVSTWADAPDMGFSTWDDAPKESGIAAKIQPITDAILTAKDKVVEATGISPKKAEEVIDSATTQIKDFASKTMKSAEELGANVKTALGDAYEATKDAAMHATGMSDDTDSKTPMKQNKDQLPKTPAKKTTDKSQSKWKLF